MNPSDPFQSYDSSSGDGWCPYPAPSILIPLSANEDDFKQRARLMAYQQLLFRMFGSSFECVPISGGFSGSSVVKITPFDRLGNREESVIVKLDSAHNIRIEVANSMQAQAALGDIAARVLGEPLYFRSDTDGLEYGGFKMELAGAVLQVPELSSTSAESPMINTFKDLVVFESEEAVLGKLLRESDCVNTLRLRGVDSDSEDESRMHSTANLHHRIEAAGDQRPFGSTSAIVKELFGQDGSATRSLRRFEESASSVSRRVSASDPNHPSGAEFLLARLPSQLKPRADVIAVLDKIGYSGDSPYDLVNSALRAVQGALCDCPNDWRVLRGFSHGDLNGSNIIIDAMEGMWLIDFATARKLPLASDLAKLETCLLFEYAFFPFPAQWLARVSAEVGVAQLATWLRVDESLLSAFLEAAPPHWTDDTVNKILLDLAEEFGASDVRRLRARICTDQTAFWHSIELFSGPVIDVLVPRGPVFESVAQLGDRRRIVTKSLPPELAAVQSALTSIERMRQYSFSDVEKLFRAIQAEDEPGGLFNWDVSSIEFSVVLLREAARLVRYKDVSPWTKVVVAKFANLLALSVTSEAKTLGGQLRRVYLPPAPVVLSISRTTTPDTSSAETHVFSHDEAATGAGALDEALLSQRLSEELKKYAKHMKARFGFLTDFVSGRQLDVLTQCCQLRLVGSDDSSFTEQELLLESGGVVVSGVPGAGKSCLLRRLVVEALATAVGGASHELTGLLPVYVSAADWVKVLTEADASDTRSGDCCLETYLRAVLVDDDVRLRLVKFSLAQRRAVLLVDGLDDAQAFPQITECLRHKAMKGIRVIATSALAQSGSAPLGFKELRIAPLDRDQRRTIVKARLDQQNLPRFEAFFDLLENSSAPFETDQGALIKSPAFLSMLVCYWSTLGAGGVADPGLERQQTRRALQPVGTPETPPLTRMMSAAGSSELSGLIRTATVDTDGIPLVRAVSPLVSTVQGPSSGSLVDVYRVAVSVLVHRYQMFQESDRSKVRDSARRLTELLRLIAFNMKLGRVEAASESLIVMQLAEQHRAEVEKLLERVRGGKFLLLSYSVGSGEYRFCLAGLLDVLAAEHLVHDPHCFEIPVSLTELIGDSWWLPPLAIFVEKAPVKYVRLIERKLLSSVGARDGSDETCLHIAARAGHWPLFRVLTRSSLLESLVQRPNSASLLPLHEAARSSSPSAALICKALIAARADVWATTGDGWCALHYAASFHNREVCSALLADARNVAGSYSQLPRMPRQQLSRLSAAGLDLGRRILRQELSSSEFIAAAKLVFPELSYFRGRSDTTPDASASVNLEPSEIEYRRTLGAMLSVFWIVADRYDEFVASQNTAVRLSSESWAAIRRWAVNEVGLTTPEAVDAMLSLMAIHDLGKLKDFRNDLASDYKDHDAAMRYIIATTPEVLPSLCRLPDKFQQTVKSALSLDFNFGQFLQSENLPANLVAIKDLFATTGQDTLAFYLFHIFADMAGIMGAVTLSGSVFMTETMYGNFALGITALSQLAQREPLAVYDGFLADRASAQGLSAPLGEPQRSIVRLACLSRIFDEPGGAELGTAWHELSDTTKQVLVTHLSRTGLEVKQTAFLLYYAPAFMENARRSLGLRAAMEFLARIFEAAEAEFRSPAGPLKACVVVHIAEAAELAKRTSGKSCSLTSVCFRIVRSTGSRRLSEATVRISPWRLLEAGSALPVVPSGAVTDLKRYPEISFCGPSVPTRVQVLHALLTGDQPGFAALHKCPSRTFADLSGYVRQLLCDEQLMELGFVVAALSGVSTLDQLKLDLSMPAASSAVLVIGHPSVFPSFARLGELGKAVVVKCLQAPFFLEQLVNGERMNAAAISRLLAHLTTPAEKAVYTAFSLAAADTLSESFTAVFRFAAGLLLRTDGPDQFKLDWIRFRGEHQGLGHFAPTSPRHQPATPTADTETLVHIACLARVQFATGGCLVHAAYSQLPPGERLTLNRFLAQAQVDGLSCFLAACKDNARVGLDQGLAVVVKVAQRTDLDSPTTISFQPLVSRAERHAVPLPFWNIDLLLTDRCQTIEVSGGSLIPVQDSGVLQSLAVAAGNFVSTQSLDQDLVSVYPELDAFSLAHNGGPGAVATDSISPDQTVASASAAAANEIERKRTSTAIYSLLQVLSNQYEQFTRAQQGDKLTLTSWLELREWLTTVLANPESLDAVIVYLVVVGVGRLTGVSAIGHPELYPSFQRLSWKYRSLIERSIAGEFNFGQFLQAESLPEDLDSLQAFVRANGGFGLQFHLAFVFAQQAGLLGGKSSDGSLFMTNDRWQIFRAGQTVIGELEFESPKSVYGKYLLRRGGAVLSGFRGSGEMVALARLCCLARVSSERDARTLEMGLDDLEAADAKELVERLCAGVTTGTGVLVTYLPALLENLRQNASVPVAGHLRILLEVLRVAALSGAKKVSAKHLANWARDVQIYEPTFFTTVRFHVDQDNQLRVV